MNITTIIWNEVTIKCEADSSKNRTLQHVLVTFLDGHLTLRQHPDGANQTYIKAQIVNLTPWAATFTASWFSVKFGSNDFDEITPVKVECVF
jgi:hypothetical protein